MFQLRPWTRGLTEAQLRRASRQQGLHEIRSARAETESAPTPLLRGGTALRNCDGGREEQASQFRRRGPLPSLHAISRARKSMPRLRLGILVPLTGGSLRIPLKAISHSGGKPITVPVGNRSGVGAKRRWHFDVAKTDRNRQVESVRSAAKGETRTRRKGCGERGGTVADRIGRFQFWTSPLMFQRGQ
jgi:hypothetical protein